MAIQTLQLLLLAAIAAAVSGQSRSTPYTYGNEFNFGFLNNLNGQTSGLFLVLTTASTSLISVEVAGGGASRTVEISSTSSGIASVDRSFLISNNDFSNRNKGLSAKSQENTTFSVLAINLFTGTFGEYLSYPCHDLGLVNYTYIAVSTDSLVPGAHSQILLVACRNNTRITITPTHPVQLPLDAQTNPANITTIGSGESHTVILHEQQTLLFNNTEMDLSGTVIDSNHPLTVVSGHECGNVLRAGFCEHLSIQIPPTATWGTEFLLAPFAGRTSGQFFKVTPFEANTVIQLTCDPPALNLAPAQFSFTTTSNSYCSLVSSKPVLVTQWTLGGQSEGTGDPTVAPVPPIAQFINRVSFFVYPINFRFNSFISVTVPAANFSENNILLNSSPFVCTWRFFNSSRGIIGYGCTASISSGSYVMSHRYENGTFSVLVYGHSTQHVSYAYNAGMKLEVLSPTEQEITTEAPEVVDSLDFFDLTNVPNVNELPKNLEALSDPIPIDGIPIAGRVFYTAYVSENGIISLGTRWFYDKPERFPTRDRYIQSRFVFAPYWSDNDIRREGTVRYVVIKEGEGGFGFDDGTRYFTDATSLVQRRYFREFQAHAMLVAQWENVHPFPHGSPDADVNDDSLSKTNTYQAVLITDYVHTYWFYTYVCDRMQWSATKSGKHAVVGYNAGRIRLYNHPASGFDFIVSTAGNCGRRAKRSAAFGFTISNDEGNIGLLEINEAECRRLESCDLTVIRREEMNNVNGMIPRCPPTRSQIRTEMEFMVQPDTNGDGCNCYVWAFSVEQGSGTGVSRQYTRQCCYANSGNLVTTHSTSRGCAGVLLPYHPLNQFEQYNDTELVFKNTCCQVGLCFRYYEARIIDDGSNYNPPMIGASYMDPHYVTLDRGRYSFMGRGQFVLMRINSADNAGQPLFEIQAENTQISGRSFTAVTRLTFGVPNTDNIFEIDRENGMQLFHTRRVRDRSEVTRTAATRANPMIFGDSLVFWDRGFIRCSFKTGVSLYVYIRTAWFNTIVYVARRHGGQTVGLLGNGDGDRTNDFRNRAGTVLASGSNSRRVYNHMLNWRVNSEDPVMFTDKNAQRGKRQSFTPLFPDEIEYTAEQRAICGDDRGCLFDFAATGSKDVAEENLESVVELENTTSSLNNFPPNITGDAVFEVETGELSIYIFQAEDDSGDNFTVEVVGGLPPNSSLTDDDNGTYTFQWALFEVVPFELSFLAIDGDGASSSLTPTVEICACKNGGNCTLMGAPPTNTSYVLNCNCPAAYSGRFCGDDANGCSEIQCFDGVECIDVQAPGHGAACGPCPTGYIGDGEKCLDIDECSNDQTNHCSQICINSFGSFMCSCERGYRLVRETGQCQDINECEGANDCQQRCTNLMGSYNCSCQDGFTLNSDGKTCTVQNPCQDEGGCSHTCAAVNGIAQCFCPAGYTLPRPTDTQCVDQDECTLFRPCDQICTNTVGSFTCSCRTGYNYLEELRICEDIDECEEAARNDSSICVENSDCINTLGSYRCACFEGYLLVNGSCQRVELPPPPVVSLPTVIAENNIRITVENYNKSNFTGKALSRFKKIAQINVVLLGIWRYGYQLINVIPYPSSNYAINGIIIESTIEDNSRGQVTFLFYATFNNGIIPRNVLSIIVEQRKTWLTNGGFDVVY